MTQLYRKSEIFVRNMLQNFVVILQQYVRI
jgi:hypothetical protein